MENLTDNGRDPGSTAGSECEGKAVVMGVVSFTPFFDAI
jgi:hypothetical protein